MGCIMAEMFRLKPLFTGKNSLEQFFKYVSVLGSPTKEDLSCWPGVALDPKFRGFEKQPINNLIPNASL